MVMADLLSERRARVAAALGLTDEILLLASGEPLPLPENTDQCYPFIAHAEYAYLSANEGPGGVIAYDPKEKPGSDWVDFVPEITEGERIWEGRTQAPGRLLRELEGWLAARQGRPVVLLGEPLKGVAAAQPQTQRTRQLLTHARRPKDAGELALLRQAAAATAAGYRRIQNILTPGLTERDLQVELEAEFFRHGAGQPGFGTIVGSGPNSAVLHFAPSSRRISEGDFVLVDSGAQVGRYTADVTRTLVAGKPSAFQRDLYDCVLRAQVRAIGACRPGAEWKEVHLDCAVQLTAGLVAMGVMRGDPRDLVEREVHTLFFPHGLGHLVGLGVRDGSGVLPGRVKDPRPCLRTLRMDLPLQEGYVVTVEPGLYFIPPILQDPVRRERHAKDVNWALVDSQLHVGGVRIEDDVLVTSDGPDVLTAMIPKTLA
jgi:Xaa-Pro aminopeptidase